VELSRAFSIEAELIHGSFGVGIGVRRKPFL
jgi:hypothetical protein